MCSVAAEEYGSCILAESRVFTIAASFGFSIFVLVYVAASFSGESLAPWSILVAGCPWVAAQCPTTGDMRTWRCTLDSAVRLQVAISTRQ